MRSKVTVLKLDPQGKEVYRWQGEVRSQSETEVKLDTVFANPDFDQHGLHLQTGDRLIESYYFHAWYNIFEVRDRRGEAIKGWYCNVSYPAEMDDGVISFRDLALDLVVLPDGRQIVLDEDEFDVLQISQEIREKAITALKDLQDLFKGQVEPPQ